MPLQPLSFACSAALLCFLPDILLCALCYVCCRLLPWSRRSISALLSALVKFVSVLGKTFLQQKWQLWMLISWLYFLAIKCCYTCHHNINYLKNCHSSPLPTLHVLLPLNIAAILCRSSGQVWPYWCFWALLKSCFWTCVQCQLVAYCFPLVCNSISENCMNIESTQHSFFLITILVAAYSVREYDVGDCLIFPVFSLWSPRL